MTHRETYRETHRETFRFKREAGKAANDPRTSQLAGNDLLANPLIIQLPSEEARL